MNLNREIRRLSVPAVVSNLAVPLLGLCDTAISGHLGSVSYLGAIAVGVMMVNPVFWLFGFLRMGTTGLTAQAFGAGDKSSLSRLFSQAVSLGIFIGLLLCALSVPLGNILAELMDAGDEISDLAVNYFRMLMCAAPALLGTMAILGWMLGMQNTVKPMVISIGVNIINIPLSLFLVFVAGMGFKGIALGTVIADWIGFFTAILLAKSLAKDIPLWSGWNSIIQFSSMVRFFKVNTDILFRSACIMSVSMAMTAMGARMGSLFLASNAVMLQFFHTFSYFMDGLAFTAEALCGRFVGEADKPMLKMAVKRLLLWGVVLTLIFTLVYALGCGRAAGLLTSRQEVVKMVAKYWYWVAAIPLVSVWAFIFDGIFIGLTATRRMLGATAAATAVFFSISLIHRFPDIDILWCAFLGYLLTRGVVLALLTPDTINSHKLLS